MNGCLELEPSGVKQEFKALKGIEIGGVIVSTFDVGRYLRNLGYRFFGCRITKVKASVVS